MTEKTPILTKIQNELKAPKSQFNSFGKYSYRNAEDILDALKPVLAKYGASTYTDEEWGEIGGETYCRAIVHYQDPETKITTTGLAFKEKTKKGMDASQLSGATASYAKKYALGNLFMIDDNKDADSMDNRQKAPVKQSKSVPSKPVQKVQPVQKSAEQLKEQAEKRNVMFNGLEISLLTLYQDARHDGKGSETAKALKEISNGDATIMNLVRELAKAGV